MRIVRRILASLLLWASCLAAAPGDALLYDLESVWHDQAGKETRLSSFRGTPVFLAMFYASCTTSCPMTVNLLQRIERALPKDKSVHFVLVAFGGTADSAKRLSAFAALYQLTASKWTLLSGRADDVRDLAAVLGVRFKSTANREIILSTGFVLVNSHGVISDRMDDLSADPARIIQAALVP